MDVGREPYYISKFYPITQLDSTTITLEARVVLTEAGYYRVNV